MSVQSEIDRIHGNVQDTIAAIRQTGISVPSGANSDNLPALAEALANEKQDKLTGIEGQVVGFNEAGEAVAQDAPEGGITQAAADARYLQLTGGFLNGPLMMSTASPDIMLMTEAGVDKAVISLNGSFIPEDGLQLVSVHPSGGGVVGLSVNHNGVANNGEAALRLMVNNPQAGGSKMYNVIHEGNKDEYEYPPNYHTHSEYVSVDGDTMAGDLSIPLHEAAGDPGILQAEIRVGGITLREDMDGSYLRFTGLGQVTSNGTLAVGMLPDNAGSVADASGFLFSDGSLEAAGIPAGITATKDLSMAGHKVTGLAAPVADADAATKAYVDAAAEAVVPVSRGGTGKTTLSSGQALIGAGTGAVATRAITNNVSTSSSISLSSNLITSSTLRYAINRGSSVAAADTSYGTYMARGIAAGTADLTAGESALTSGCIYFVYE